MKKFLLTSVLIGLLVLPVAGALAADPTTPPITAPVSDTMQVLDNIVNWLFAFLLIFAAIMIIIAAFSFVTAAGNPETVAKARQFVIYALIGVVVAFMAKGMIVLVGRIATTG